MLRFTQAIDFFLLEGIQLERLISGSLSGKSLENTQPQFPHLLEDPLLNRAKWYGLQWLLLEGCWGGNVGVIFASGNPYSTPVYSRDPGVSKGLCICLYPSSLFVHLNEQLK